MKLQASYLAENNSEAIIRFYRDFAELLKLENTALDAAAVTPIHQAYFHEKTLVDGAELQEVCALVRKALRLKKEEDYTDHSRHFDSGRELRQKLMQHLHHRLVNLGDAFTERCYSEYRKLGIRLTRAPQGLEREPSQASVRTFGALAIAP